MSRFARLLTSAIFLGTLSVVGLPLLPAATAAPEVTTYIPPQAYPYLPLVRSETLRLFQHAPSVAYFPALIEHESCISLTHKRCWNPGSELKTARERGLGLGQITIAYREDGTVRFDKLEEMRAAYQKELKELSWLTLSARPDLQIRAIILQVKANYDRLYRVTSDWDRLQMADSAYNGGAGGLDKERLACGLAKDCDPQRWIDHVEKRCLKSKKALYGTRSACDINRHHVLDTTVIRLPKYRAALYKKIGT